MIGKALNPNLRLALLGGEGLRSQSAPLWQKLFALTRDSQPHIALIPAAFSSQPLSQSERRTHITSSQLAEFGCSTTVVSPSTEPLSLNGTKIAYLPGGDQRAAVNSLQNTPLWQSLIAPSSNIQLLIASGGSAVAFGEQAFAPLKPYPMDLDDLEFELIVGLGLMTNIMIVPYFSWLQEPVIAKIRALAPDSTLVGIDDQAALISDPGGWRVMGLGIISIYMPKHQPQTFDPGAQIPPSILTPFP